MEISLDVIKWFASASSIVAALMVSADMGRKTTGWGFVVFTASSIAWIVAGSMDTEPSITTQNLVLLGINILGIWRWLLRPLKRGSA